MSQITSLSDLGLQAGVNKQFPSISLEYDSHVGVLIVRSDVDRGDVEACRVMFIRSYGGRSYGGSYGVIFGKYAVLSRNEMKSLAGFFNHIESVVAGNERGASDDRS
jgi:hypothetical protein